MESGGGIKYVYSNHLLPHEECVRVGFYLLGCGMEGEPAFETSSESDNTWMEQECSKFNCRKLGYFSLKEAQRSTFLS